MAKNSVFSCECELAGQAFSQALSGRVLKWQLGGTMVAAIWYVVFRSLLNPSSNGLILLFGALGFVGAFLLLTLTGCLANRVLQAPEEEDRTGPLHFLVDHLGAATLLPLVFAGVAVGLVAAFYGLAALWRYETWQGILVIPSALMFVILFLTISSLLVLLFLAPAMIVSEHPSFAFGLRKIVGLFRSRRLELARLFAVGLLGAVIVALPMMILALTTVDVSVWIARRAEIFGFTEFAGFVLCLFTAALLWAPVLTLPLAFLNAFWLKAYDGLTEGMESGEEGAGEEDLQGDEEADLEVHGEEKPAPPAKEQPKETEDKPASDTTT